MNIIEVDHCPDGTHFDMRSLEPDIKPDGLHIYSGKGTRRSSWGTPGNESTIVYNDDRLTTIHIAWWHKYRGGQAWRFYQDGKRLASWKQLTEAERLLILDALHDLNMPAWVKQPGKLTKDYIKPHLHNKVETDNGGNIIAYKWLARAPDGCLVSLINDTRWENLELTADRLPTAKNSNGVYCAKTYNSPILEAYRSTGRALVQLLLSGVVIEANYGYRAEHAEIISVLEER
jgi:hypothetical protein